MNNFRAEKKFNWGACLMGWIWGIFNKSWITLIQIPLGLIPKYGWILGIICGIWFGVKGNEWALKNKKFDNLQEFNKYQKKFVIAYLIIIMLVSAASLAHPILIKKAEKLINTNDYQQAARVFRISSKIAFIKKDRQNDYLNTAACYLELKDINNVIRYMQKAEKLNNKPLSRLTDLYIITDNYDKVIKRGDKYKLCAYQADWACMVEELNYKINQELTTDKHIVTPSLYLERAIAYKNLGEKYAAEDDFKTAYILVKPELKNSYKQSYENSKNYYKEYYERIKKALEIK